MRFQHQQYKWLHSFAVVIILYVLVNLVLFPLFNSGDDVFLLYQVSGGFGDEPTRLLQYDHIWHPLLGGILQFLFRQFPGFNWYTAVLILFQVAATATLLYVFFRKFRPGTALLFFGIYFCFIGIRALLSLNFTYSAWILAVAGFSLLVLCIGAGAKGDRANLVFAFLLLLLSGLLRLQVTFAVTLLFLPVLLLQWRSHFRVWVPVILLLAGLLYGANLWQKHYYRSHIPGWESAEKYRQSLFYAYNRTLHLGKPWQSVFRDSTEKALYGSQFFYDTSYLSEQRVARIGKDLVRYRDLSRPDDREALHWLFIGWRIYLLLFAVSLFICWQQGILSQVWRRWRIPAGFVLGFYFYLFVFLKITEPVHLGVIALLWVHLVDAIPETRAGSLFMGKQSGYYLLLFLVPLAGICVRLERKNRDNRERHLQFSCVTNELRQHPGWLFIATDDALPLDYFYIWDSPAKNRIGNLIYKDRVITRSYNGTLQRFGIRELLPAISLNPNVYLLGRDLPELQQYYKQRFDLDIRLSPRLEGFKCLELRKAYAPARDSLVGKFIGNKNR